MSFRLESNGDGMLEFVRAFVPGHRVLPRQSQSPRTQVPFE